MHDAIVTNGKFAIGQTVFIQGATSGVGIMGLQIAKALGASKIIGSSTNESKLSKLLDYGADVLINTSKNDWLNSVLNATDGKGVDILIDMLSGNFVNKNMEATKINGYLINIGRLAGMNGDFNYDLHAKRRLHYVGTTGRTRSVEEIRSVYLDMWNDLGNAVIAGQLSLPIEKVYDFNDVAQALSSMRDNQHFGKLILRL